MSVSVTPALLAGFVFLFGLNACQQETEAPQETPAVEPVSMTETVADDIPLGQLPTDVTPLAYQLELTIVLDWKSLAAKL